MIVLVIITAIVLFAVFMKTHSLHKKPLQTAIVNMLLSTGTLLAVSAFLPVNVNIYTMFIALTLGIPGNVLVILGTLLL
ncbi:MAG: hypothetical protein FWD34_04365 [Oscillospiraceae bacterium]|nr:hypothetical protein [Oscillospiraceae bacterium]